jgi:hypothetical protein
MVYSITKLVAIWLNDRTKMLGSWPSLPFQHEFDSSALLVMKAHQQNTWKTSIFRSLNFCHAITVRKTRKRLFCRRLSFIGLEKAKKELKGSAQKDSFEPMKFVSPSLLLEAVQNALTQQGKCCATVHHSLDELDPGHLPFCLRVVGGVR